MTNTIKVLIGVAVLVVGFVLGSLAGFKSSPVTPVVQPLGSISFDQSNIVGDVYQGPNGILMMRNGTLVAPTISGVFSTSTTASGTFTAANIANVGTILASSSGAVTLTLPASTTLRTFLPTAGYNRTIMFMNQGTGVITLAGGTGTLLQTASSTKAVAIGGSADINCVRKTNTDIVCNMSSAQ